MSFQEDIDSGHCLFKSQFHSGFNFFNAEHISFAIIRALLSFHQFLCPALRRLFSSQAKGERQYFAFLHYNFFRSNFRRKLTLTSDLCRTRQLARSASFTPLKRRSYIVKCFPVSRNVSRFPKIFDGSGPDIWVR